MWNLLTQMFLSPSENQSVEEPKRLNYYSYMKLLTLNSEIMAESEGLKG